MTPFFRRNLWEHIKRHVSVSYRRVSQGKLPRAGATNIKWYTNATMLKLRQFFLQEYAQKGEEGLPCRMVETDPEDTNNEYYDRCITAYKNKPVGYETTVKKEIGKEKAKCNRNMAHPRQDPELLDAGPINIPSAAALPAHTSSGSTAKSVSQQVAGPNTSSSEPESATARASHRNAKGKRLTMPMHTANTTAQDDSLTHVSPSSSPDQDIPRRPHTARNATQGDERASAKVPRS